MFTGLPFYLDSLRNTAPVFVRCCYFYVTSWRLLGDCCSFWVVALSTFIRVSPAQLYSESQDTIDTTAGRPYPIRIGADVCCSSCLGSLCVHGTATAHIRVQLEPIVSFTVSSYLRCIAGVVYKCPRRRFLSPPFFARKCELRDGTKCGVCAPKFAIRVRKIEACGIKFEGHRTNFEANGVIFRAYDWAVSVGNSIACLIHSATFSYMCAYFCSM